MTPLELLRSTSPTINELGAAFYFVPETAARGEDLGLNAYQLYALGRGGVLGDTSPAVVMSAFGYFNPGLVDALWSSAAAIVAPTVAAAAYHECCAEFGRAKLAGVEELEQFVAAAESVVAAADTHGLALFAGIAALTPAGDTPGRAMQLLTILRELRGSAHLVALRASGLESRIAHFITRPDDIELFGWTKDDATAVTDQHRAARAAAEELTERLVLPAFEVLDEAGRAAFATGIDRINAALTAP